MDKRLKSAVFNATETESRLLIAHIRNRFPVWPITLMEVSNKEFVRIISDDTWKNEGYVHSEIEETEYGFIYTTCSGRTLEYNRAENCLKANYGEEGSVLFHSFVKETLFKVRISMIGPDPIKYSYEAFRERAEQHRDNLIREKGIDYADYVEYDVFLTQIVLQTVAPGLNNVISDIMNDLIYNKEFFENAKKLKRR
ncbi:MAG: hypothetical protein HXS54_01430 [Theionarchaea archaeon]|nr:hypothetical protein [Theionarchaea archaeon]